MFSDAAAWRPYLTGSSVAIVVVTLLVSGGGNSPAAAAGAAATFVLLLFGVALTCPSFRLLAVLGENRVPLCAFALFVSYAIATALPAPAGLAHPLYNTLGLEQGAISLNPSRALEGLAKLLGPAAAYAAGALSVNRSSDRDRLAGPLLVAGLAYSLYALADYLAELGQAGHRLDAGLGSANAAATVFGLFILAAMASAVRASRQSGSSGHVRVLRAVARAPLAFSVIFLSMTGLLLTASRAGVTATFAAAAAMALLLTLGSRRRGASGGGALVALTLAIGLVALLGAHITAERLVGTTLDDGRVETFIVHWRAFLDRPWTGHGLNTFHAINRFYGTPENWDAIARVGAAHNVILQHLEETGLIGAALFALMLLPPVVRALGAALAGRSGRAWSCLVLAATMLVFGHGMADFGLNVPGIAALYTFLLGAYSARNVPSG